MWSNLSNDILNNSAHIIIILQLTYLVNQLGHRKKIKTFLDFT